MEIPGYAIERLIAEGGMASVYLAIQSSLRRRVALKVLKRFDTPEQATRFLDEGRIIASLNHRNIITIHDIGVVGERHYIAMEYLDGGSLADRIGSGMDPSQALDLVASIGACLDFVHRRGIVHRDVKPGNILFHADGTPKLTDFGIAKQLDADQELTLEGSAFGSPYYLSPEQAEGKALDGRADIYALGIVFYEMLAGHKPFAGESHIETIMAHLSDPVPQLPGRFTRFQQMLERMIAKDPGVRFASAAEVAEFAGALRAGIGVEGHADAGGPGPGLDPANGASERKRLGLRPRTLLAAALVSLVAGTAIHLRSGTDRVSRSLIVPLSEQAALSPRGEVAAPEGVAGTGTADGAFDPGETHAPGAGRFSGSLQSAEAEAIADSMPGGYGAETVSAADGVETEGTLGDESPVERWLQEAQTAVADYRLTTPARNSAYHYYTMVLQQEPAHEKALAGLDLIADRYAVLVENALNDRNLDRADRYLSRGLRVQPEHRRLQALRTRLAEERASREQPGFFEALRSIFQ